MTRTTYQTGIQAEFWCRLLLRLKFYRILAVRYKTPIGEIDIVAARGKMVIAIEVKARPSIREGIESISQSQRARIARALQDFVMRHPRYASHDLRFDVMVAIPHRPPRHITHAWRADD